MTPFAPVLSVFSAVSTYDSGVHLSVTPECQSLWSFSPVCHTSAFDCMCNIVKASASWLQCCLFQLHCLSSVAIRGCHVSQFCRFLSLWSLCSRTLSGICISKYQYSATESMRFVAAHCRLFCLCSWLAILPPGSWPPCKDVWPFFSLSLSPSTWPGV